MYNAFIRIRKWAVAWLLVCTLATLAGITYRAAEIRRQGERIVMIDGGRTLVLTHLSNEQKREKE